MVANVLVPSASRRPVLIVTLAALIGLISVFTMTAATKSAAQPASKPTIVLVHGAWADASSWNGVIERLQQEGYRTIALPNPLRGLTSDSAYIATTLASIPGPIVLVAHSYGGAVITNAAAGNPNVKALVYVAAFIPDEGEPLGALLAQFPGSQIDPATSFDVREYSLPDGSTGHDAYFKPAVLRQIFAADLPEKTTAQMAATQRPIEVASLGEPSGPAAWKTIPAYCMVATEDNAIGTANVRAMAQRACPATNIVEIKASHVVLISKPKPVADLILTAARGVQ